MWRGPVIEAKRQANNAKKGKIFSIHSKIITLSTRNGWEDTDKNPSLAEAIKKANKENVPADVIKKAIDRGMGRMKEDSIIEEIIYEWFGSEGVSFVIRAITDNRNRTISGIRAVFNKNSGNLGEPGSATSFLFDHMWEIHIHPKDNNDEDIIIDSGAEDYEKEDGIWKVYTKKENMISVKTFLEKSQYSIDSFSLAYIPKNFIEVKDFDNALKNIKLLQDLLSNEDVEEVWWNADIWDDLYRKVLEKIEASRFKT